MEQQLIPKPRRSPQQGFALVLVLCGLVLISILVVAYLSSVGTELQSSKSYASGAYTRQLSDTALNLVIAQIREATSGTSGTNEIWTSQPGLIRTYRADGSLDTMYKLYSSNQWRTTGKFDPTADIPTDWNKRPADYTDLNSPVLDGTGGACFPIMDGNLKVLTINGTNSLTYDSNGDGSPDISGFSIPVSSVPTYQSTQPISASNNPAPMPVQWMYLLNDGQINTASAATASNPIVARIAFWTDDETSKVNINTASEGTFWEMPLIAGANNNLASAAPQAKEYQRLPGHPATTSLSAVLSCLVPDPTGTTAAADLRNFIYGLAPRVSGRGSQGTQYGNTSSSFPVSLDHDRLYDDVDELAFLPDVSGSTGPRYDMTSANLQSLRSGQLDWHFNTTGQQNTAGSSYSFTQSIKIDESVVPKLRFFLTAQSRAPELNLLSRPRISLWPVDTRPDYISATDQTLAFCSTIGGKPYYFQRQNPKSPTDDYLKIQRNQDLYGNLQNILKNPVPGFGSNTFATKYASGQSDQILTEIFDWVRSGVNLAYPSNTVKQYAYYPFTGNGTLVPPGQPGSGQVVPIQIGITRGFGRFATLSKAAYELVLEDQQTGVPTTNQTTFTMRFVMLLETYVPMMGYAGYIPDYTMSISGLQNAPVVHVYDTSDPAGTDQAITADTQDGSIKMNVPSNVEPFFGRAWGGMQGFFTPFFYLDSNNTVQPRTLNSNDPLTGYPFASTQGKLKFVVTGTTATDWATKRVTIDGFTCNLKIADDDPNGPNTMQTFSLPFTQAKGMALPVKSGTANPPLDSSQNSPDLQERINQVYGVAVMTPTGGNTEYDNRTPKSILVSGSNGGDIVRGLELSHGDIRLLAVSATGSTTTYFTPHVNFSGTLAMAHSLLRPSGAIDGMEITDAKEATKSTHIPKRGVLVSSSSFVSSARDYHPQATSGANLLSLVKQNGDFTNALTTEGDGPLIMKPDEGNAGINVGYNFSQSALFPYRNQLFPFDVTYLSNTFSPNREVASAVQLGTLPTGATVNGGASEKPWQTLLFRPNFSGNTHPGSAAPEDHLLLDLFWMPVVDPYPISEPFSTAGKINMNYQIMPFTYIRRDTGVRAVLKSVKIMAVTPTDSNNSFSSYKWANTSLTKNPIPDFIYDTDVDKTMLFFDERFADSTQQAFKSASEICDIPLVPKQTSVSSGGAVLPTNIDTTAMNNATSTSSLRTLLQQFWQAASLSGDNMIENTYNEIYPRLTTKSNTYTVHVRVQSLKKINATPANAFYDPNDTSIKGPKDLITGEYRGSFAIERYIDPNDSRFTTTGSSAVNPDTDSLDAMYKFRVLNTKQFTP